MNLKDLVNREISVIVDGLNKPCGGRLVDVSDTLLTLKPTMGNNNVLVIPISRIASIMYTERGTDDRNRENKLR